MMTNAFRVIYVLCLVGLYACSPKEIALKLQYKNVLTAPDSVKIAWNAENAEKVAIAGIADDLPTQGSRTLYFDAMTQYEIIAQSGKRSTKRALKIPIRQPEIVYFNGDVVIAKGKKTRLNWETRYFKSLKLGLLDSTGKVQAWIAQNLLPQSKLELKIDTTTTYVLEGIAYDDKPLQAKWRTEVVYEGRFGGDANVSPRDSARLMWNYPEHRDITLWRIQGNTQELIAQNLPEAGSLKVAPSAIALQYRLQAVRGSRDTIRANFTVNPRVAGIGVFMSVCPQDNFRSVQASNCSIEANQSVILQWNTTDLKDLRIEGVQYDLPPKGSVRVTPRRSINTYTLRGYDRDGMEHIRNVVINVRHRKYIKNLVKRDDLARGQKIIFDIMEVDRSNYPREVRLKVVAVDTLGNFVADLASNDATARQYFLGVVERASGKATNIKNFNVREVNKLISKPYAIGVAADYSGSMSDYIAPVEKAIKTLITDKHPQDQLSVVKFDDKIAQESPLEEDEERLLKNVKFDLLSRYGGSTALYAGAGAGLQSLDSSALNRMLLLITDGYENSSFQYFGKYPHSASQVVGLARANNTKINTLSLGQGTNVNVLSKMAMLTDGYAYYVSRPEDVSLVYQEMARIFRNYYEIIYQPVGGEGEREVSLIYNNLIKRDTVGRLYHMGDNYDIDSDELIGNPGMSTLVPRGKKLVAPPQVLVNFQFNEAFIERQYEAQLKIYADYMRQNPQTTLVISGHTDLVGDAQRQIGLSERRAESVKAYLVGKSIDADRISTKGYGKSRPLWAKEDAPWQARENRRIEVMLLE